MHRRAMAKRKLGLFKAAVEDLKIAKEMVASSSPERQALDVEMKGTIADMLEAERKKKAAAAAPPPKQFHYKGGVTIEEHISDDEEEAISGGMSVSDMQNVEAQAARRALQLKKQAQTAREKWESEQQQQQQQAPKRRTIVVEEADSSEEEEEKEAHVVRSPSATSATSSTVLRSANYPSPKGSAPAAAAEARTAEAEAAPPAAPAEAGTSSTPAPAASSPPAPEQRPAPQQQQAPPKAARLHEAASAKAAAAIDKLATKRPPPPKSAVEFETSCKLVASNPEVLVDFVKSVDPETYQAVFKQALNHTVIAVIVQALKHDAANDPQFAELALSKLVTVNRFALVVPMLPRADKAALAEVFGVLEAAGGDVKELRGKYKV
mmetsp:Transcript_19672/g.42734  ORF Transcript_19672/g.42734 Transcript_19672/m.42734 type:complete len:379 (+) Transcript_19672:694-1830(+)